MVDDPASQRTTATGPAVGEDDKQPTDDHQQIVVQLGMLFRHVHALHQQLRREVGGPSLDRAAYGLFGHLTRHGPMRLSTLADAMRLDLSTVSRQVAMWETAGWLERRPDPADRRASLVQLTEAGHTALRRHFERMSAVIRQRLAGWDAAERREFARLLTKFNDTVGGSSQKPCPMATKR